MWQEFKKFILRGNVVDLAVAVVVGAAFNAVVQALVRDFITPLLTAAGGGKVQGILHIGSKITFNWGDFVTAIVSFLVIAVVVFVFVVHPINKLVELSKRNKNSEDPSTKKCPECLSEVPVDARRCAYCTIKLKT